MHIRLRHEIIHTFAEPPRAANRKLLLTPRNYQGQLIANWRIDLDHNCRLRESEDAFGNIQHCYSVDGPFDRLIIVVEGEAETFDTAGVVKGAAERFPPELYLRETPLTAPSLELRAFALQASAAGGDALAKLHALLGALHDRLAVDATAPMRGAAETFAAGAGDCRDLAHVFIACARAIDAPARFVSGYLCSDAGQSAPHAWAEAHVENLGWVGFDVGAGASPGENYLRVAAALDALGAQPVKCAQAGGRAASESQSFRAAVGGQLQA